MENKIDTELIDVVDSTWRPSDEMIKVIGVGGGGCNAINYMHARHIGGCSLMVCNTDSQALLKSPVPIKIQLGEGLGAGTDPIKGRNAALHSQDRIREVALTEGTKMLFITAGMGGGTGTGASPEIARMAKERGILTVAVVTLPFKNEGNSFLSNAVDGITELQKNVDSLLIINNEKLFSCFGDSLIHEAFPKVDEILATAVQAIVEIITKPGYVNVDFRDVETMMKNSGLALMGCGTGTGKDRIRTAVKEAFESPLLNDFDLKTARNLLLNITVGRNEQGGTMTELEALTNLIKEYIGDVEKSKRGIIFNDDPDFGDRINITAIATGFKMNLTEITGPEMGKLILINSDFRYESRPWGRPENGEIELPGENIVIEKIGPNTKRNKKAFHFNPDEKPCLCVAPGEPIAELEQTPAIHRPSPLM